MASVKAYVKLSRLEHGLMVALAVFTGAFAVEEMGVFSIGKIIKLVLGMVSGVLVEAGIFAFNDYFNVEEDRINAPDRPLVTGELSLREAFLFGFLTLSAGVLINALINLYALVLVALTAFIGMLYNAYFKKSGIFGNFLVAYSTALPFVYGALVLGYFPEVPLNVILFSAVAFFAALGREIVKGIRDIEGDRKADVRTLAIIAGSQTAATLASLLFITAVILSIYLHFFVKNPLLYLALLAPTDLIFLYSAYSIVEKPTIENADSLRKKTLIGMALGIMSFFLSSL